MQDACMTTPGRAFASIPWTERPAKPRPARHWPEACHAHELQPSRGDTRHTSCTVPQAGATALLHSSHPDYIRRRGWKEQQDSVRLPPSAALYIIQIWSFCARKRVKKEEEDDSASSLPDVLLLDSLSLTTLNGYAKGRGKKKYLG